MRRSSSGGDRRAGSWRQNADSDASSASSRPTLSHSGGSGRRGSSRRPPSSDFSDADIRGIVQTSAAQSTVALCINAHAVPSLHANVRAFYALFPHEGAADTEVVVHVPLARFGLNDWEQRIVFQRVLTNQRRPTASDATDATEAVLAARADVVSTSAATWTYALSLAPPAQDALWAFTNALVLQMRSAGVYGHPVLPVRSSLERYVLASAVATGDSPHSHEHLHWSGTVQWSALTVDDARSHTVEQVVHLPDTEATTPARPLQIPELVALVDELLQQNAETKQPAVVVLRGIPGSGKSTLSREIAALCAARTPTPATCATMSADQYFVGPRGYVFDVKQIGRAHDACKAAFDDALRRNVADIVVVDNTHTQAWEYAHYVSQARASGCRVRVLEMRCPDLTTCVAMAKRNAHGVPVPKVVQMFLRWDADSSALAFTPHVETHALVNRNPMSQSPASTPVYVALFLDASDRVKLLRAFPPSHANVIAEHVTLYYRPTTGYVRGVEIGDTVVVRATELVQDARGQCLRVELVSPIALKVHTKVPHITLSTATGVGAYYSNELLQDARASRRVLPVDQQVSITARVGVSVLALNQRVVTTTSPFASSRLSAAPGCTDASRVVMLRVDETSLENAVSAAHSPDLVLLNLAVREQLRHSLGSSCSTHRVLCLVASSASSVERLLKQLESLLLLTSNDRHQLVFDKVVVVAPSSLRVALEDACRTVSPRSIKSVVVLTTLAQDLSAFPADDTVDDERRPSLLGSAHVSVSRLELSVPEASTHSVALSAPMSLTLDGAMDCLSLGVQERTRNAIHHGTVLARRAWEAVLGTTADSEAVVVERIDSTLVGADAAVVQLCAFTSGAVDLDVTTLCTRLVKELTAVGVRHLALGLEPGVVYFTACSSAEYSPVFRLQIADGSDRHSSVVQRLDFCRQLRAQANELRETETYTTLAELLSALLRVHSVRVPGDIVVAPVLNLVSERTALAFLKQSPEFTSGYTPGNNYSDANSDSDVNSVLWLLLKFLQYLSEWTDDKWRAEVASVETLWGADARTVVSARQLSGAVALAIETIQRWEHETSGRIYKARWASKRTTAVVQVLFALVSPSPASRDDSVVTRVVEVANASSLLDALVACEAMRNAATSDDVDAEKTRVACAPSALSPTRVEVAAAPQELLLTLEATARLERLTLSAHEG